jgi:hypothetical protein
MNYVPEIQFVGLSPKATMAFQAQSDPITKDF